MRVKKKTFLQARRRSDTFLEAWDQVVYYFFKIIWVAKVARFLSLCLFNVKTNKPQNIPTCSNISFVIRRFEHQFKQLSKQIALKSLQPIEFCSHHPKNSKKMAKKKKTGHIQSRTTKAESMSYSCSGLSHTWFPLPHMCTVPHYGGEFVPKTLRCHNSAGVRFRSTSLKKPTQHMKGVGAEMGEQIEELNGAYGANLRWLSCCDGSIFLCFSIFFHCFAFSWKVKPVYR